METYGKMVVDWNVLVILMVTNWWLTGDLFGKMGGLMECIGDFNGDLLGICLMVILMVTYWGFV